MSRYPSEDVARFDQQFAETETERNERLKARRIAKIKANTADPHDHSIGMTEAAIGEGD